MHQGLILLCFASSAILYPPLSVDEEVLMIRCPLRGVWRTLEVPKMRDKSIILLSFGLLGNLLLPARYTKYHQSVLPVVDEWDVLALLDELGPAPPLKTPDAKFPPTLCPPVTFDPSAPGLERSNRSDITEKGSRHILPSLKRNAK